uniref:Homologous recombination OB-fold protein OB-fold domain-containing protein n=1 Tax=Tanacetum cinerariifolium TaxID=118510 RepID=A0A6L2N377_TANCI|nr:hypothetical protein [Tanacetum cinerariifolium]
MDALKNHIVHTYEQIVCDFPCMFEMCLCDVDRIDMWFHCVVVMSIGYISRKCCHFNNENDPWEFSIDIDDSDLRLTPVLHFSSSTSVEPSPLTPNPFRLIPGPTDIIQQAKLLKEKSCFLNVTGDLTVTIKDLSGTIPGTIHYKVIGEGGYGKNITVGAAMILVNVSAFTPKASMHYLNTTKKNVVTVFRKDTVLASGSG